MVVKVYWNLHQQCWSVMNSKGIVVAHKSELVLADCTFVVRPAGRARVLREGVKNVHAFVKGVLAAIGRWPEAGTVQVGYNPHKGPSFFLKDEPDRNVNRAELVYMSQTRNVFAKNPS